MELDLKNVGAFIAVWYAAWKHCNLGERLTMLLLAGGMAMGLGAYSVSCHGLPAWASAVLYLPTAWAFFLAYVKVSRWFIRNDPVLVSAWEADCDRLCNGITGLLSARTRKQT